MVERQNPLQTTGRGTPASTAAASIARPERGQAERPALGGAAPAQERGWQRFGQPGATGLGQVNPATASPALTGPAQRGGTIENLQTQQAAQQPQGTGWQRFGTGQPRAVPEKPTTTAPPRQAQPAAPAGRGQGESASRSFSPQARPAPSERAVSPAPQAAPRSGSEPGWNRFSPRAESSFATGNEGRFSSAPRSQMSFPSQREAPAARSAPRSSERQPLNIRRSIVTERAPRASGGENRGWSAPSSGGRSAVAPPARSSGGGRSAPAPRQSSPRSRH